MAQQILEADDHGRLKTHAERLVHHIHDADAASVGERLHLHDPSLSTEKWPGTPAVLNPSVPGLRSVQAEKTCFSRLEGESLDLLGREVRLTPAAFLLDHGGQRPPYKGLNEAGYNAVPQ